MTEYAVIRMMRTVDGNPAVKLDAQNAFMDLPPRDRAILLNAALHLCVTGINAILDDYEDEAGEIMDLLEGMSISAQAALRN